MHFENVIALTQLKDERLSIDLEEPKIRPVFAIADGVATINSDGSVFQAAAASIGMGNDLITETLGVH